MQKKKMIIVWRPFGEKRTEIAQVLTQICDLNRDYPELVTPSIARRLQDEGYFNLEERPWDYLMLLGYIKHLLFLERQIVPEANGRIYRICRELEVFYRHPTKWVGQAFDAAPDFAKRYTDLTGEPLPRLIYAPRGCEGRYAMAYVLQTFTFDTDTKAAQLGIQENVILREMRDFLAATENPPLALLRDIDEDLAALPSIPAGKKCPAISEGSSANAEPLVPATPAETMRAIG